MVPVWNHARAHHGAEALLPQIPKTTEWRVARVEGGRAVAQRSTPDMSTEVPLRSCTAPARSTYNPGNVQGAWHTTRRTDIRLLSPEKPRPEAERANLGSSPSSAFIRPHQAERSAHDALQPGASRYGCARVGALRVALGGGIMHPCRGVPLPNARRPLPPLPFVLIRARPHSPPSGIDRGEAQLFVVAPAGDELRRELLAVARAQALGIPSPWRG